MKAVFLVFLVLILAGCRVVYPGDGRLVVADLKSPEAIMLTPKGASVSRTDLVRFGAHMWDLAGAQIRLRDEVSPEAAAGAPTIPLFFSQLPSHPNSSADEIGLFVDASGKIYIEMKPLDRPYDHPGWEWGQVIAHELGHAMGLEHVNGWMAIMAPAADIWLQELSDADLSEHARVWP